MRLLRKIIRDDDRMLPLTLDGYNALIALAVAASPLPEELCGWTAHSPRAGFATDMYLSKGPSALPLIQHICRWQTPKTLIIYLDVVGAAASAQSRRLEDFAHVADAAAAEFRAALISSLRQLANI